MMEVIVSKRCSVCKSVKPLSDYYRRDDNADGRMAACKECASDRANRRYRERKAAGFVRRRNVGRVEALSPLPTMSEGERTQCAQFRKAMCAWPAERRAFM